MKSFREFLDDLMDDYPEISFGLHQCGNLDRAFRFLSKVGFAISEIDIVAQDEFTLDVILPFQNDLRVLVLGVT